MRLVPLVAVASLAALASCSPSSNSTEGADAGGTETGTDSGTGQGTDAGHSDASVSQDASTPLDAGCTPPTFDKPVTGEPIQAVIITNNALAPVFRRLAALHTVTGLATDVATVEQICAGGKCSSTDTTKDTPKAIKDYLKSRSQLRFAVIGGGIDVVPSRQVHDSYTNTAAQVAFDANFVTDDYYSDFSEWDTNGDGIYAQDGTDTPGYGADIAVSRIPVHTTAEAEDYLAKVVKHMTAFNPNVVDRALAISNISTNFNASFTTVKVDAAWYLEQSGRTLSLLPAGTTVTKLYATRLQPDQTAGTYSAANELQALNDGQNIVVHSGHAGTDVVTVEIDGTEAFWGTDAYAMTNSDRPIFLSCGCQAGDFSAAYNAGEQLVLAPAGGAVAYLGNVPVGLGLAGGMQMIDELLRYVGANGDGTILGDASVHAHRNLPLNDRFTVPYVNISIPVVDKDSWEWTQKGATLLGDELIPVWTATRTWAPIISASKAAVCQGAKITVTLSAASTGTLRLKTDSGVYRFDLNNQTSVTATLKENPSSISVGFSSSANYFGFAELSL